MIVRHHVPPAHGALTPAQWSLLLPQLAIAREFRD
jgi:hypothetical protein